MGLSKSKSININNYLNTTEIENYKRSLSAPGTQVLLPSYRYENNNNDFNDLDRKQRSCLKKKVLILGLDGVGKTELFTQLICWDKKKLKIDSLPRPTLGYNVETIRLHCHHLCHRQYHEITLWDCGGQLPVRSLWSYHYSNTSLLVWLINIHDRSRLDTSIFLLSQILTNPMLNRVPVAIILYNSSFHPYYEKKSNTNTNENLLTNLEVSFRFLATLSTLQASTFKWQVINVTLDEKNSEANLKKLRQCFIELMEL
ncbi:unnamed protein product [Rotaria magnacalcarata]|uniref:Uncharacterized protein n=2 Tax=Rotaria magnacalcarata TaxID=392030 RepID=A0A816ZBA2_9BILA|nr:unnamed protein product [Rotaria magnacalcarata]CAF1434780.1 unnamed protein product [Rotaria magnacalcarata]CAF2067737.1 unnamed protein product [Rotaria magnacalcarata]CAF2187556.1 unnamed protein product [Rotaria magnacalcarata]CAF3798101.1 unnamed protein product [Rotaria magnacalcarata]